MKINEKIKILREDKEVANIVLQRLKEFEENYKKDDICWFKELCFCLMTANFKAQGCIDICEEERKSNAFINYNEENLSKFLKQEKHRFPNARAKYITEARKYKSKLKNIITGFDDENRAREWLVKNIKGIGYKESSHLLRNIGYKNVAILDRHILNVLYENKIIREIPKNLNKKTYFEIEKLMENIAKDSNLSLAELDLFLWCMKTGKVLK